MATTKRLVGIMTLVGALGLGIETASAQNTVIANTGTHVSGAYYDFNTMQWRVRTDQQVVLDSALDPNRHVIDPGSYRRVSRYFTDYNGIIWHESGYRWTSYGVPHSKLTRHRVSHVGPGVAVDQNVTVVRSAAPRTAIVRSPRVVSPRRRLPRMRIGIGF